MRSFDCELYMDLMPLVKDGAASSASREAVETHIRECESCKELFETLPNSLQPEESAVSVLKKIRRSLNLSGWVLILTASVIGALLTLSEGMGYNIILFPLAGIIAYWIAGKQSWRSSLHIGVFSLLFLLIRLLFMGDSLSSGEVISCAAFSLFYAVAYLIGIGVAALVHNTFTRPVQSDRKAHIRKILSGTLALIAAAAVFLLCDTFLGNPIACAAVRNHSRGYLAQQYPALELTVSDPRYDWYSGGYYDVAVTSPNSRDTHFYLHYDRLGRLTWDGYEDLVASGENTFARIYQEYSTGTQEVQRSLQDKLPVSVSFTLASDWPSIYDGYNYPFYPEQRIIISELIPDREYDIAELAAQYGNISLWGQTEEVSDAEICRLLRTLKEELEKAGITVSTVGVDIYDRDGNAMGIASFPYDAIGSEDFETKVHEARIAWDVFQAEFDAAVAANDS